MSRHCIAHAVLFVAYVTIAGILMLEGAYPHCACVVVIALAYLALAIMELRKDENH